MVWDDACFGVPDLRRREQGLLTVDALDGIDHPRALLTGGKGAGAMSSLTTLRKSTLTSLIHRDKLVVGSWSGVVFMGGELTESVGPIGPPATRCESPAVRSTVYRYGERLRSFPAESLNRCSVSSRGERSAVQQRPHVVSGAAGPRPQS